MLSPMNPTLPTPNFSHIEVTETKTPSVVFQESVDFWTSQADHLPKAEKAALLSIINRLARNISLKIDSLSKARCSSPIIKMNIENSLAQLNQSARVFYQSKQSFIEERKNVEQRFLSLNQGVQDLTPPEFSSSQALAKETKPLYNKILETNTPALPTQLALHPYSYIKRLSANPHESKTEEKEKEKEKVNFADIWMKVQRNQMMEEMNNVIITSNIIELLDRTKNLVIRNCLETVCHSNPKIHRTCRKTKIALLEGSHFLIEQIPQEVKNLIRQYFTHINKMHEKATLYDAERNATMYGIPHNVTIESREASITVTLKTVDLIFGTYLKDLVKSSKLASRQKKLQLLFDIVKSEPLNIDANESQQIIPLNSIRSNYSALKDLKDHLPDWHIQGIENYLLLNGMQKYY